MLGKSLFLGEQIAAQNFWKLQIGEQIATQNFWKLQIGEQIATQNFWKLLIGGQIATQNFWELQKIKHHGIPKFVEKEIRYKITISSV